MAARKRKAESVKVNSFGRAKKSKVGAEQSEPSTPKLLKEADDVKNEGSSEAEFDYLNDNGVSESIDAGNSETELESSFKQAKDFAYMVKFGKKEKGADLNGTLD
jgi:hypothetical protein